MLKPIAWSKQRDIELDPSNEFLDPKEEKAIGGLRPGRSQEGP